MRFRKRHPAAAFLYYAGLAGFIFYCAHPLFLCAGLAGVLCLAAVYAGPGVWRRQLKFLLPLALFVGLLNPLFVRRGATILFYLLGSPVTREACWYGFYSAGFLLCVVLLFVSFNRVVDQAAFLYLAGGVLPRAALTASLSLRALARFRARAAEAAGVWRTRGISLRKGPYRKRVQAALAVFRAFTDRCLEEGLETAEVIKARDYGTARRRSYRRYPFRARDLGWLLALAALAGFVLYAYPPGVGAYLFYPKAESPALAPAGVRVWAAYAGYVFFPVIGEAAGAAFCALRFRKERLGRRVTQH